MDVNNENKENIIEKTPIKEPIKFGGWLILVFTGILAGIYYYTEYLMESFLLLFMNKYEDINISKEYLGYEVSLFLISIALLFTAIISLILFTQKRKIFIKWFICAF